MGPRSGQGSPEVRRFRPPWLSVFVLALLALSAAAQAPSDKPAVPPEFRVGPGDVLRIDVWKEPEVSGDVQVRPDGRISLPLIKDLEVTGMTPMEMQRVLGERLGKFIANPDVTVVVRQINSKKVYLMGQVRRVGPLPLLSPLTVAQALSEAGGPTEYANTKKIFVLRNQDGKQTRYNFNFKNFLKGEGQQDNILLQPGDTIVVP